MPVREVGSDSGSLTSFFSDRDSLGDVEGTKLADSSTVTRSNKQQSRPVRDGLTASECNRVLLARRVVM